MIEENNSTQVEALATTTQKIAENYQGWLRLLCLFLAAMLLRLFFVHTPQQWDSIVHIDCAQHILDGKIPYVGFVEMNPPGIMYFSIIPLVLSHMAHINPVVFFPFFVWFVISLSCAASAIYLNKRLTHKDAKYFGLLLFSFAALNFALPYICGQREQLFMLALFPFFLIRWSRAENLPPSRVEAVLAGICAGYTVCIKPQFSWIIIGLELYWWWRRRQMRIFIEPELIAFVITGIAFLLHFLFVPESMRHEFFLRWIPIIHQGYASFSLPFGQVLVYNVLYTIYFPLVFIVLGFSRRFFQRSSFIAPLAVWTLFGIVVKFVQNGLWIYQAAPLLCGMWLLMIMEIALFIESRPNSKFAQLSAPTAALAFVVAVGTSFYPDFVLSQEDWTNRNAVKNLVLTDTKKGDLVVILSTGNGEAYPLLVETERQAGSRFQSLFMVADLEYMTAHAKTAAQTAYAQQQKQQLTDELDADICSNQPRLILFKVKNVQACVKGFSVLRFFQDQGLFAKKGMKSYEDIGPCGDFEAYRLKN